MLFLCLLLFLYGCNSVCSNVATDIKVDWGKYKTVSFWNTDTVEIVPDTLFVGMMNEGETSIVKFAVSNKSDEDIYISDINSGCGCTNIEYRKGIIGPGERILATIQYNSSGQFGKQLKTITIFSKIGEKRQIILAADVLY